jgi:hypothetical protein
MPFTDLSPRDQQIAFECLRAAAKGPFFTDYDLAVVFGLSRQQLLAVVARIPHLDDTEPEVRRAIGHAFNELLRYPHNMHKHWGAWISATPAEVEAVEGRWWRLQPPLEFSSLEVHGPSCINGIFYRVVVYKVRGGGEGHVSEVWHKGRWLSNEDGPGCNQILQAPVASKELLRQAGVDDGPLPPEYDPLRAE